MTTTTLDPRTVRSVLDLSASENRHLLIIVVAAGLGWIIIRRALAALSNPRKDQPMTQPDMPALGAPEIEREIYYKTWWHSPVSTALLRGWRSERILVLTEIDTNEGPSIIRGAHAAWAAVEVALDIDLLAETWSCFEHFPRSAAIDQITFGARSPHRIDSNRQMADIRYVPVERSTYERLRDGLADTRSDSQQVT